MSSLSSYLGGLSQHSRHSNKLSTMPRPHLCTLPAEIKGLIISEGMKGVMTKVENNDGRMRFGTFYREDSPIAGGLLGTCRLLREETYAYLGANIPLEIATPYFVSDRPLAALPLAYKLTLQHIKVDLDYYPDLPWAVKNLPSLKTLHMDYKDLDMEKQLSAMFRSGNLTL